MRGSSPNQNQGNLFYTPLKQLLNPGHPLYLLSEEIDWPGLESKLSVHYSSKGRPAHSIRLMAGLLILKQLDNLGDETVVSKWVENPYYQYFCGVDIFQWNFPIDPSDLVYFRKRIGEEGIEHIFQASVQIHGKAAEEEQICIDTTAQTKAITYPTDAKLHKKIIEYCWRIAKNEQIKLRQSYRRKVKDYMRAQHNGQHPKRRKSARSARKKLFTITGRLIRDLVRKFSESQLAQYAPLLKIFEQVVNQKKNDKNKIYSIHAPEVACIAKGKAYPKYEYGSKACIAQTKKSGIIVAAQNFQGNPHDNKTLIPLLLQYHRIQGKLPKVGIVDRGFRGPKEVFTMKVLSPDKPKKSKTPYQKRKARQQFRRRAAIEPIIGHLKNRFRLSRNWLKGAKGDRMNLILAAAAFNFKKWMNKAIQPLFELFFALIFESGSRQRQLERYS